MAEKTIQTMQDSQKVAPQESTRSENRFYTPPVDIFEKDKELVVIADLPGADKDSVSIKVENGVLTVQAAVMHKIPGDIIYKEFERGNFYRQFEISDEIDSNRIAAELKNGVLTLLLPKVEKPSKLIDVTVS